MQHTTYWTAIILFEEDRERPVEKGQWMGTLIGPTGQHRVLTRSMIRQIHGAYYTERGEESIQGVFGVGYASILLDGYKTTISVFVPVGQQAMWSFPILLIEEDKRDQ